MFVATTGLKILVFDILSDPLILKLGYNATCARKRMKVGGFCLDVAKYFVSTGGAVCSNVLDTQANSG